MSRYAFVLIVLLASSSLSYGVERVTLIGDSTTQCWGSGIDPAVVARGALRYAPKGSRYRRAVVDNFGLGATSSYSWAVQNAYCIPGWHELGFPLMRECLRDPLAPTVQYIHPRYTTAIVQLGINDLLTYDAFGLTIEDTIANLAELERYWKETRGEDAVILFIAPHHIDESRPPLVEHRQNLVDAIEYDHEYENVPKVSDGVHLTQKACALVGAEIANLLWDIPR